MDLKGRNFLTLKDFTAEEIIYLVDLAAELKEKKNTSVIMITHDSHVAGFAKRRVDIFDGEISEYKPQEVTL